MNIDERTIERLGQRAADRINKLNHDYDWSFGEFSEVYDLVATAFEDGQTIARSSVEDGLGRLPVFTPLERRVDSRGEAYTSAEFEYPEYVERKAVLELLRKASGSVRP